MFFRRFPCYGCSWEARYCRIFLRHGKGPSQLPGCRAVLCCSRIWTADHTELWWCAVHQRFLRSRCRGQKLKYFMISLALLKYMNSTSAWLAIEPWLGPRGQAFDTSGRPIYLHYIEDLVHPTNGSMGLVFFLNSTKWVVVNKDQKHGIICRQRHGKHYRSWQSFLSFKLCLSGPREPTVQCKDGSCLQLIHEPVSSWSKARTSCMTRFRAELASLKDELEKAACKYFMKLRDSLLRKPHRSDGPTFHGMDFVWKPWLLNNSGHFWKHCGSESAGQLDCWRWLWLWCCSETRWSLGDPRQIFCTSILLHFKIR